MLSFVDKFSSGLVDEIMTSEYRNALELLKRAISMGSLVSKGDGDGDGDGDLVLTRVSRAFVCVVATDIPEGDQQRLR